MTVFSEPIPSLRSIPNKWLAYFDLLGFSKLVGSGNYQRVYQSLDEAITKASHLEENLQIHAAWFSDTFLIYTRSSSESGFPQIELAARQFLFHLLKNRIPVRGAISFGEFYSDKRRSIFFGRALIEAYQHGEAQDWIGLILCPSVVKKLLDLFDSPRLNYATCSVPISEAGRKRLGTAELRLPAHIVGQDWSYHAIGEHPGISVLESLRKTAPPAEKGKYERAISFIKQNRRVFQSTGK